MASVTARLGKPDEAGEHRRRYAELKSENPLTQHRFQVVYEATLRGIVIMTLCNAAAEYQRQGQPQEAERLYRKALELNPNDPDTCRWLASLYHALGRTADARILQQRLVELEPNRVENYLNLASLSAQLGQDEAAEQMLLTAIRVEPRLAIGYRSLASLYLGRGQHADACKFAEKAVQLEPSVDGYLLLAVASKQLGDVSGAQAALRHARRLAPNDPRVQNVDP
jgi:tetratricopeptide (TPR) repeat protein